MADPFDKDEMLLDDEWVELCDLEGHRASFRHLATIGLNQKTYMVLGAAHDGEDLSGVLMLIREDETADGTNQYMVVNDKQEIEHVIRHFVMRLITAHTEDMDAEKDDAINLCGCIHGPREFCFCNNPEYLQ